MTDLKNVNGAIMSLEESDLLHVILYGNKNFDGNMNLRVLTATVKFIKEIFWKVWLTSFLTIIKTIFILSSITFLIFFFKKFVMLLLTYLP